MLSGVGNGFLDGIALVDGEVQLCPHELEVVGQAHGGDEGVIVGGDEERKGLGKTLQEGLLLGVYREQPDPGYVMGPRILSDAG